MVAPEIIYVVRATLPMIFRTRVDDVPTLDGGGRLRRLAFGVGEVFGSGSTCTSKPSDA